MSAFENSEKYYVIESWYGNETIQGNVRIQLSIIDMTNTGCKFRIEKDMTPFSKKINVTSLAELNNSIYYFKFTDNFGNSVTGNFHQDKNKLKLYMDCTKYSDSRKNLARLYGDHYILEKGTISFE